MWNPADIGENPAGFRKNPADSGENPAVIDKNPAESGKNPADAILRFLRIGLKRDQQYRTLYQTL